MKRFYCTVCKKVKRVQEWPVTMDARVPTDVNDVSLRTGACNRHMGVMHSTVRVSIRQNYKKGA